MAEEKLKIVQSPEIADVELPLPAHYNGLDLPILDGYIQGDAHTIANAIAAAAAGGGTSALEVKVGSFALNTGTGAQAITGVGFTPKLIFFLSTPDTANVAIDAADYHQMLGMADSVITNTVMYANSGNAISPTDSINFFDNKAIVSYTPAGGGGAVNYAASVTSMDTDGFTINVSTAPASGYIVGYLALGGDGIVNQKILSSSWSTSTGLHSVTGSGFTPTAVVVMGGDGAGSTIKANARFNVGYAQGSTQGQMYNVDSDNVVTSSAARNATTTKFANQNSDAGVNDVNFTSFDSNGFSYTTNTAPPTGRIFGAMAVSTTLVKAGVFQLPTSTGSSSVTGVGFKPKAGMFFSICSPLSGSVNDAQFSFSFVQSSGAQFMTGGLTKNSVNPSKASHFSSTTGMYRSTTAFSGSIDEEANFAQWDSDGFTLNVTTALGSNPAQIQYVVFG